MRIFSLFLILFSLNVEAKWASIEDANSKIDFESSIIEIKEDGTYEEEYETTITILKEAAREKFSNYRFYYNGHAEKLEVIEAKAIVGGKEYPVEKRLIEDKPLASLGHGFDEHRQILIAFPKVEIGAKISYKLKISCLKPNLKGFYSDFIAFGINTLLENSYLKIKSHIPLNIYVSDPNKSLKIIGDNSQNIEITLTKPVYRQVIGENVSHVPEENYTYVELSSLKNWEDLAKLEAKINYDESYQEELPPALEEIAKIASKEKNDIDKINSVTSQIQDKIQYMGDWRSVDGRFKPRKLAEIVESQVGDCKDFSAVTLATLNRLGFDAKFAIVYRGFNRFKYNLPSIIATNHAMVRVKTKNETYWIDPTNFQSMAGGIFADIAESDALIMDGDNSTYESIPAIDAEHAKVTLSRELEIQKDNKVLETGTVILKNEEALGLTGAELKTSRAALKDEIYRLISKTALEEENKLYIDFPPLNSRIVKDVKIDYKILEPNKALKTNLGSAIGLSYLMLEPLINTSQEAVVDIFVSDPFAMERKTLIKNVKVRKVDNLNKEIKSKWVTISRKCNYKNNNLEIIEKISILKNTIKNNELKSPEFIKFKNEITKDFKEMLIVLE